MSAPIISSLLRGERAVEPPCSSRKSSWKHYAMIALVVVGIAIMGVFDV